MSSLQEPTLAEWRLYRDDLVRLAGSLVARLENDQFMDARYAFADLRNHINNDAKLQLLQRYEVDFGPFGSAGPQATGASE